MIFVNIAGLALIAAIVWWFWIATEVTTPFVSNNPHIDILVADGTYEPSRIEIPVNRATTLRFIRRDPSPCAESVVIPDLGIHQFLALNESTNITITPNKPGDIPFTCDMAMYRGVLAVRDVESPTSVDMRNQDTA